MFREVDYPDHSKDDEGDGADGDAGDSARGEGVAEVGLRGARGEVERGHGVVGYGLDVWDQVSLEDLGLLVVVDQVDAVGCRFLAEVK